MMSLHFLVTALVVVIAPGTGVIYTLATGLGQGRRAAFMAALGCTLGIVPALVAATLGLAALLHSSALLFQVVKFAGVAYLLWLAFQAVKSDGALAVRPDRRSEPGLTIARRGALINTEMLSLGAVFMALTFIVFTLYGSFAAAMRDRLLASERAMRWLNRSFAAIFATLGARLALEKTA